MDQRTGNGANWTQAREPVFNAPAVVLALIGLLVAIHAALEFAGEDWRIWTLYAFAFIPSRLTDPGFPIIPGSPVWSFVTYALLHGGWMHLLLNALWLLIFGTPVARYLGTPRFLLLSVVAAVGGAAASLALYWGQTIVLVGASGIVSGLLGAAIPIMYAKPVFSGRRPLGPRELLTNGRAMGFMLVFFLITILTGATGWTGQSFMSEGGIAWEAHLGGFLAGLATFYLLAPRRVA